MDATPIEAICTAQASANMAALNARGIDIDAPMRVAVDNYDDVEAIAEIIYGTDGWQHVHVDRSGGWTVASIESPEGVVFHFSDYDLNKAVMHVREARLVNDQWEVTDRDVKAVDA